MSIENGLINSLDHKPPQSKHTLNLDDAWILPGLIDSHLHLLMGGLSLGRLDLAGARSREEFEKLIDARARRNLRQTAGWNLSDGMKTIGAVQNQIRLGFAVRVIVPPSHGDVINIARSSINTPAQFLA